MEGRGPVGAKHTSADYVEDGVKDLAQGMYSGSPRSSRSREMRLNVGPFGIG